MGRFRRRRRRVARGGFWSQRRRIGEDRNLRKAKPRKERKNVVKKIVIAVSVSALMAVTGLCSLQAQVDSPSKVTGGGAFLDVGWWASPEAQPPEYTEASLEDPMGSWEVVSFAVSIHPSGKAEVRASSPSLSRFWGGQLVLSGPWEEWVSEDPWMQDDKPAQEFKFLVTHPVHGEVAVWVFLNDNWTPGAVADWGWADWVGIGIEPADGDGLRTYEPWKYLWMDPQVRPENDNLFALVGPLVRGNIMDHRLPGASTGGHGKNKTPAPVQ